MIGHKNSLLKLKKKKKERERNLKISPVLLGWMISFFKAGFLFSVA